MKILVMIKQVPNVEQLKFDAQTRRLVRDGVSTEINPFDRRAISQAVKLRDLLSGEVIAVTMGPPQAKEVLIEALAMGCDHAVHLLGREFAGSDTLATAQTLALACLKIGYDLILCGKYSTDAETAQVPGMLAEFLDIPQVTGVTGVEFAVDGLHFSAQRETDEGIETVETILPALLSASERLIKSIKPDESAWASARQKEVQELSAADLSSDLNSFGSNASQTEVSEIYSIKPTRKCNVRQAFRNVDQAVDSVVQDLIGEGLFGVWKSGPQDRIIPDKRQGSLEQAIWVVAELSNEKIRSVTLEILGRGIELSRETGGQLAVVLIGQGVTKHVAELAAYGADRVYLADSTRLAEYNTEGYAGVLAQAIKDFNPFAVLIPSTANGRDLAPRVAARLRLGLTGDCIGLKLDDQIHLVQLKPSFGGNIIAPILSKTRPAMATLRPGLLQKAEPDYSRKAELVRLDGLDKIEIRTRSVKIERSEEDHTALESGEIVVSIGMGVDGAENLQVVRDLAQSLGAEISATRRVVDAGWLPRECQVGLTGRSIAPRLYAALGISGQFNHMVGVQRAGLILAVNNDPEAEIFQQCDYGLVGDFLNVAPALTHAILKTKNQIGK